MGIWRYPNLKTEGTEDSENDSFQESSISRPAERIFGGTTHSFLGSKHTKYFRRVQEIIAQIPHVVGTILKFVVAHEHWDRTP